MSEAGEIVAALAARGWNDREIAEAIGCRRASIHAIRHGHASGARLLPDLRALATQRVRAGEIAAQALPTPTQAPAPAPRQRPAPLTGDALLAHVAEMLAYLPDWAREMSTTPAPAAMPTPAATPTPTTPAPAPAARLAPDPPAWQLRRATPRIERTPVSLPWSIPTYHATQPVAASIPTPAATPGKNERRPSLLARILSHPPAPPVPGSDAWATTHAARVMGMGMTQHDRR